MLSSDQPCCITICKICQWDSGRCGGGKRASKVDNYGKIHLENHPNHEVAFLEAQLGDVNIDEIGCIRDE